MKQNIYLSIITPIKGNLEIGKIISKIYEKSNIIKNIPNCEFLFILDGAKKNKVSKIRRILPLKDNLKIFGYEQNKGPGIARNVGIKKCKGKKIIFLDFDDFIIIKNLKKLISYSKKQSLLIACDYKINIPGNKKNITNFKKNKDFYKSKKRLDYLINQSINREVIYYLFDKKMLINKNIFFDKCFFEDILFLIKFFFYYKKKIKLFKNNLGIKIHNKKSITNEINKKYVIDKLEAWKKVGNFLKKNKLNRLNLQSRFRSEFYNIYIEINHKVPKKKLKGKLMQIYNKYLNNMLERKFEIQTKKDKFIQKIIKNEIL